MGPHVCKLSHGNNKIIKDKDGNIFIPPAPRQRSSSGAKHDECDAKRQLVAPEAATGGSFTTIVDKAGFNVRAFTREAATLRTLISTPRCLLPTKLRRRINAGCIYTHKATFRLPHATGALAHTHCSLALSQDGSRLLAEPNAGGNSVTSEVASLEILRRVFSNGSLHKTEMEINYGMPDWDGVRPMSSTGMSTKTDYVMSVQDTCGNARRIAVSVTRAMHFPRKHHPEFTRHDAERLIRKKLKCVYFSNRYVVPRDKWDQQVLHVLTDDYSKARLVKKAFRKMEEELRRNAILVVTVTENARFLFVHDKHMCAVADGGGVVWDADMAPSPVLSALSDSEEEDAVAAIHIPFSLCAVA